MDQKMRERIKTLFKSKDEELKSLAKSLFWANDPSWEDVKFVEEPTFYNYKNREREFLEIKKQKEDEKRDTTKTA